MFGTAYFQNTSHSSQQFSIQNFENTERVYCSLCILEQGNLIAELYVLKGGGVIFSGSFINGKSQKIINLYFYF